MWSSLRHAGAWPAPPSRRVLDEPPGAGFQFWQVGDVLVGMPKLSSSLVRVNLGGVFIDASG